MDISIKLIVDFIKLIIANMCVYYCFQKMLNLKENNLKNAIVLAPINIILLGVYMNIKSSIDSFLPFIALMVVYAMILSKLTKNQIGCSLLVTVLSYAVVFSINTISVIIQFVPYKILETFFHFDNLYVSLVIITGLQLLLLYLFFRIKRFRNGFSFLNNKLNNEVTDIIVVNISAIIIMVYCMFETYQIEIKKKLIMTFVLIVIIMFFTIKKMFTLYYKQRLLTDTMEEYKKELEEKQNEIDRLKSENKNVSKVTHEFYNRQKALELLVASNMNEENIDKENVSQSVLNIIETLTSEYAGRFETLKELPKLETTEISELDNMFKYMQSECDKNNISFKLKVIGNIHSLVNNIIDKSKLETLIGDHLRDAINAVNLSDNENKEILAVLGLKNKKYEFSVFDTGIDFEIDTLLKLGIEAVTTNKDRGGTGTGFMTTFETLKETKASLVITEYEHTKENPYSKCVTIRFDGKNEYRIDSYRAKEIKNKAIDGRIKIECNKK